VTGDFRKQVEEPAVILVPIVALVKDAHDIVRLFFRCLNKYLKMRVPLLLRVLYDSSTSSASRLSVSSLPTP
jgi:hypothetical protein